MDIIEQERQRTEDGEPIWRFKRISAHQGPLKPGHPDYKGSSYNVKVEWEDGSTSYEPLSIFGTDQPTVCAVYARDNDLLELPRWKRFK